MRHRSPKRAREYVARRALVARLLVERPVCERCHAARSTEVHERLSRARGGSIADPSNCAALCHDCHAHITVNVAQAQADGWLIHSWDNEGAQQ